MVLELFNMKMIGRDLADALIDQETSLEGNLALQRVALTQEIESSPSRKEHDRVGSLLKARRRFENLKDKRVQFSLYS